MTKDNKEISKATLNRLPSYLKYLYQLDKLNVATVSSTTIANGLNLNPVQVRKDIALVSSVAGKPKMGYVTKEIIADLEGFLGYNNTHDAILVGVGGLGKAFFKYMEENYPAARYRLEIEPENLRAKKLYSSLGYKELPYAQMIKGV